MQGSVVLLVLGRHSPLGCAAILGEAVGVPGVLEHRFCGEEVSPRRLQAQGLDDDDEGEDDDGTAQAYPCDDAHAKRPSLMRPPGLRWWLSPRAGSR